MTQHSHTTKANNDAASSVLRRLHLAAMLCCIFLIVEVVGGTISGSLAVLSDAAHLVADLTSFGVAILAGHLAQLPSSDQHTYGLRRTESLAALLSMVSLALVSLGLAYEALRRLFFTHDTQVDGPLMSMIAFIGVLVNVTLAVVLGEHHVHLPGYSSSCSHDNSSSSSHSHGHDHAHNGSCGSHPKEETHSKKSSHDHAHNSHASHAHDHSNKQSAVASHDETFSFHHKQPCSHDHAHHEHHAVEKMEAGHQHTKEHHNHSHQHSEQTPLIPEHSHETVPEKKVSHHHDNVNLRAAYLHVMGDLAQSIAVLIAGIIIYFQPTWTIVDPIATLLFCTMVFASTLPVIRRGMAVLLEEVPPHISWTKVHDAIEAVPHVSNVHDLHIWSISDGRPGLTVHGSVESAENTTEAMRGIQRVCQSFGITHTTIQLQTEKDGECITCEGDSLCAARF